MASPHRFHFFLPDERLVLFEDETVAAQTHGVLKASGALYPSLLPWMDMEQGNGARYQKIRDVVSEKDYSLSPEAR